MSTNPNPFGGGGQQPYQFNPVSYGGAGIRGLALDVTSNGTATINSPTIAADSGAVGAAVLINGANGATAGPLGAGATPVTILSVNPGTGAVVLSAAAGGSQSGCLAVWGFDATAAVKSAISAAWAYMVANNYDAELFLDRYYMVTQPPVQQTSPFTMNTQIPAVPNTIDLTGKSRKLVLRVKTPNAGAGGDTQFFESGLPGLNGGGLISTQTAPSTPSGTLGEQSVFGGPSGGGAFTGGFANFKIFLDGVKIYWPALTNMYGYDFGYIASMEWGSFGGYAFMPANVGTSPRMIDLPPILGPTIGVGCRFPLVGNNDDCDGRTFAMQGVSLPFITGEHLASVKANSVHCDASARIDLVNGISGNSHMVYIGNWSVEDFNGGLQCNGGGTGYCMVDIRMDTESIGSSSPNYDVNDNGNLYGRIVVGDAKNRTVRAPIVLNGAPNLEVVNAMMGPGPWLNTDNPAPPAVPASGSPATNNSYRNCGVTIATGVGVTVSQVAVGGTNQNVSIPASSSGFVRVPGGKTITLTYAGGTPAWQWVRD